MLTFSATQRIYLAVEPVDMRKQFNGLNSVGVRLSGVSVRGHALTRENSSNDHPAMTDTPRLN